MKKHIYKIENCDIVSFHLSPFMTLSQFQSFLKCVLSWGSPTLFAGCHKICTFFWSLPLVSSIWKDVSTDSKSWKLSWMLSNEFLCKTTLLCINFGLILSKLGSSGLEPICLKQIFKQILSDTQHIYKVVHDFKSFHCLSIFYE